MGWTKTSMSMFALALASCSVQHPPSESAADKASALLVRQFGANTHIQTQVTGPDGVVCGYALKPNPGRFPDLKPFIFDQGILVLIENDVEAFERASRSCPPEWVAPRLAQGIE
jgi:hypothetical protein